MENYGYEICRDRGKSTTSGEDYWNVEVAHGSIRKDCKFSDFDEMFDYVKARKEEGLDVKVTQVQVRVHQYVLTDLYGIEL